MSTYSDRAGSFNPASGGYTPANRGPASEDYTLAVTYRGDVYFVPVLFSLSTISGSEIEDGETTRSNELEG
ncbi:hypothetical protein SLEP1_g50418 [Rubroshorea leprosula]|uniref:Uncharacterized protein n=1 Tax=Rubroshorea leprosula TaxID=152421 RepID=A0AAV5M0P3_9ROSI|nr:hypothetical protein SLEP1_g50418 [Rubroshorea leprosula]